MALRGQTAARVEFIRSCSFGFAVSISSVSAMLPAVSGSYLLFVTVQMLEYSVFVPFTALRRYSLVSSVVTGAFVRFLPVWPLMDVHLPSDFCSHA